MDLERDDSPERPDDYLENPHERLVDSVGASIDHEGRSTVRSGASFH